MAGNNAGMYPDDPTQGQTPAAPTPNAQPGMWSLPPMQPATLPTYVPQYNLGYANLADQFLNTSRLPGTYAQSWPWGNRAGRYGFGTGNPFSNAAGGMAPWDLSTGAMPGYGPAQQPNIGGGYMGGMLGQPQAQPQAMPQAQPQGLLGGAPRTDQGYWAMLRAGRPDMSQDQRRAAMDQRAASMADQFRNATTDAQKMALLSQPGWAGRAQINGLLDANAINSLYNRGF